MSGVKLEGNALGTGVFTIKSPNSNTDRTFDLPDVAGTVMVSGNIPAFSAWKSGATQDVGVNTWTKITFESEEFDTNSNYDTSTSRFTPTVAGYYVIDAGLIYDNNGSNRCGIYKNGSVWKETRTVNSWGCTISCLVYCNGTTDYIECYGYETTGYNVVGGSQSYTFFQGSLVRAA